MEKGRLQWVDQQASGQSLHHLPRDKYPVYLMKFDTNRSLCLPLFPAQTAIQHTVHITIRHKGEPVIKEGVAGPGTTRREVPLTLSVVIHHSS